MGWKQEIWPEWEIEEDIGAGAYGTVYRIKRQDIGGTYYAALKVISFPCKKNEVETFHRKSMTDGQISEYYHHMALEIAQEVAVMERLKGHTNIVSYEDHKIVSHKHDPGWDVLIRMELLSSLPDYLETHEIDEKEVCKLGMDICNALMLCEKEHIIHRDIKPGNIFVSDFGDYKLGDFSLAKYTKLLSEQSEPQGTYSYMAPEVLKNQKYDATIDIYSLGLILYRLLNRGRGPFQPLPPQKVTTDISEQANRKRLCTENIPKPVDASALMAQVILKACAFYPEKRYRNADELRKALVRCSSSQNAIQATRQISYYLKKAATVLQDSYENFCGESELESEKLYDGENDNEERKGQDAGKNKESGRNMNDFFSTAGDL